MNHATKILFVLALGISASAAHAEDASHYNMSLQDKVITGPKGSLTSPQAASVDEHAQTDEKHVRKIADGIYRIGGWGDRQYHRRRGARGLDYRRYRRLP